MKLFITGGAGFIGSNFTALILKKNPSWKVTVYDLLTYASNPETVREFGRNRRYKFVKGDIRDYKKTLKAMKGHDVVVNFAAETHVDRSILEPEVFTDTNVKGTDNLLRAARAHKIKKFVHISTDEVYGSVKSGKSVETDHIDPSSPYSASKAAADLLCLAYHKTFGLPVTVTRSSNNYGPYQHPEKFIPLFITNALEGKGVPLYGDGKNVRNWIYVEDNCSALEKVVKKGRPGEIYNIGGNTEQPNIRVARVILRHAAPGKDLLKFVKDRPAHDRRYALSSAKVKKLGWKPAHTFEQGLRMTIDWYKNNEKWWKRLKGKAFKKYYAKNYTGKKK